MIKEIIGNAVLYQGDCLEVMEQFEDKELDAVVTDPPYGIRIIKTGKIGDENMHRGPKGLIKGASTIFKKSDWDNSIPDIKYFLQIKRIADYQIIFGGNYFNLGPTSCFLVWDKKNGASPLSDCELAWTNLKQAVRKIEWLSCGMFRQGEMNRKTYTPRVHPTQKPVKVMEWCIEQIKLKPESTIIDPFMGSGTTGVACHNLGHRFIGVEQDAEYFDIACKRIETAQRQLNLF